MTVDQRLDRMSLAAGPEQVAPRLPRRPRLSWAPAPPPGAGATGVADSRQAESVSRDVASGTNAGGRRRRGARDDLAASARAIGPGWLEWVHDRVRRSFLPSGGSWWDMEKGITFGWDRWVGPTGAIIGMSCGVPEPGHGV
jgi:hypothetical protein